MKSSFAWKIPREKITILDDTEFYEIKVNDPGLRGLCGDLKGNKLFAELESARQSAVMKTLNGLMEEAGFDTRVTRGKWQENNRLFLHMHSQMVPEVIDVPLDGCSMRMPFERDRRRSVHVELTESNLDAIVRLAAKLAPTVEDRTAGGKRHTEYGQILTNKARNNCCYVRYCDADGARHYHSEQLLHDDYESVEEARAAAINACMAFFQAHHVAPRMAAEEAVGVDREPDGAAGAAGA